MVLYLIDVIIFTKDKKALVKRHDVDNPNFDWTHNETEYKIREGALFSKNGSRIPHLNLIYWLIQWRFYNIMFVEGIEVPLMAGRPKFSPQEIYLMNNSTILGKALRGLISKGISNRVLIIVIVLLVVIVYYVLTSGGVVVI